MPIHYVNPAGKKRKPDPRRSAAAKEAWRERKLRYGAKKGKFIGPIQQREFIGPIQQERSVSDEFIGPIQRKSPTLKLPKTKGKLLTLGEWAEKEKTKSRKKTSRAKTKKMAVKKDPKRVAAGKRAAKTRKRNLMGKVAGYAQTKRKRKATTKRRKTASKRKTTRTVRRRKTTASKTVRRTSARRRTAAPKRRRARRTVVMHFNPARKRRRRRRYLSNPGRKMRGARSLGSIRKARRTILNVKSRVRRGRGGLAGHYMRRYNMRSNPTSFKDAMQKAAPYLISLLASQGITVVVSRLLPASVSGALNVGGYDLTKPAVSAATTGLVFMATKKGALAKYRFPAVMMSMVHLGYTLAQTFLPASIKGYVGMGDSGMYDRALSMGEYVTVNGMGEYVTVNGMGEYVQVGDDLMAEMGASDIMAEMGVMEDLGRGFDDRGLGGVHRNDMLRALPPARSYLKTVGPINYNENVYTGIFSK